MFIGEMSMKEKLFKLTILAVAVLTISATFLHGTLEDISVFHGMVLHPVFLLFGLKLLALIKPALHQR